MGCTLISLMKARLLKISSNKVQTLPVVSVIAGDVDADNVGKSKLDDDQISMRQASSVQQLVDTLPGASLVGSPPCRGAND